MIKVLFLCSFSFFLFASETLSYVNQVAKKDSVRYTLQIFTCKMQKTAEKIKKKVPQNLQKDLHIYEIGKYIALRYSSAKSAHELASAVEQFKTIGFSDAYILKTTQWHMNKSILDKKIKKENPQKDANIKIKHSINKYVRSSLIQKADRAYKKGDETTAMLYYEMIVSSQSATQGIKNNLCYLYGKRGAWFEAKKLIDKERYVSKLLYAYAYGALQGGNENFVSNLAEYIMVDKSGRLALLAGYYFEQREDWQRAEGYYKMAYEKNPSDMYNVFAYARVSDIKGERAKALQLYKKVLSSVNKHNPYYTIVKRRISQLEELL